MDAGDGSPTVWMYLLPQNYTLNKGEDAKLYGICILLHQKEEKGKNTEITLLLLSNSHLIPSPGTPTITGFGVSFQRVYAYTSKYVCAGPHGEQLRPPSSNPHLLGSHMRDPPSNGPFGLTGAFRWLQPWPASWKPHERPRARTARATPKYLTHRNCEEYLLLF